MDGAFAAFDSGLGGDVASKLVTIFPLHDTYDLGAEFYRSGQEDQESVWGHSRSTLIWIFSSSILTAKAVFSVW